jgi:zinc protease
MPVILALDAALTAGRSGRLQRVLKDGGLAAEVGASVLPLRHPGLWEFSLDARPGVSAERLLAAFWAVIDVIRREGPSDGELAMGVAQYESATWASLEDAQGKASFVGWSMTHTGSARDGVARLAAIEGVTVAQAREAAARYLDPQGATVVIGRADPSPEPIPEPERVSIAPAARIPVTARVPGPAPAMPRGVVTPTRIGGVDTLLAWDDTLPLVWFRLHLPGGGALDGDRPGLAHLAANGLLRGTTRRSRSAFEEAIEQVGATVGVAIDGDAIVISGSCIARSWPTWIGLVAEALAEPSYDDDEVAQLVDETLDELALVGEDDAELAGIALRRLQLYGEDHPYGRDVRGKAASVRTLDGSALRDFHARWLGSDGASLAVAGAFDDRIEADLGALVGALAGRGGAAVAEPPPRPRVGRWLLVDKPDRTQA